MIRSVSAAVAAVALVGAPDVDFSYTSDGNNADFVQSHQALAPAAQAGSVVAVLTGGVEIVISAPAAQADDYHYWRPTLRGRLPQTDVSEWVGGTYDVSTWRYNTSNGRTDGPAQVKSRIATIAEGNTEAEAYGDLAVSPCSGPLCVIDADGEGGDSPKPALLGVKIRDYGRSAGTTIATLDEVSGPVDEVTAIQYGGLDSGGVVAVGVGSSRDGEVINTSQ